MVMAIEGIVENGRIRLRDAVRLAENTRVFVIVAETPQIPVAAMRSPRLANPQDAGDFRKHVVEIPPDARL